MMLHEIWEHTKVGWRFCLLAALVIRFRGESLFRSGESDIENADAEPEDREVA